LQNLQEKIYRNNAWIAQGTGNKILNLIHKTGNIKMQKSYQVCYTVRGVSAGVTIGRTGRQTQQQKRKKPKIYLCWI
jgi:hypothetical protein